MYKALSVQTIKHGIIDLPTNCRTTIIEKLTLFSLAFFNDHNELEQSSIGISKASLDRVTLNSVNYLIQLFTGLYKKWFFFGKLLRPDSHKKQSDQTSPDYSTENEDYFSLVINTESNCDDLEYISKEDKGLAKNSTHYIHKYFTLKPHIKLLKFRLILFLFGNEELIEFSSA